MKQPTDTEALLEWFVFLINRRIEEGAKQDELASATGLSTATISVIKNRKTSGLRLDNAETIAWVLANKQLDEAIRAARDWYRVNPRPARPLPAEPPAKQTKRRLEEVIADQRSTRNGGNKSATPPPKKKRGGK